MLIKDWLENYAASHREQASEMASKHLTASEGLPIPDTAAAPLHRTEGPRRVAGALALPGARPCVGLFCARHPLPDGLAWPCSPGSLQSGDKCLFGAHSHGLFCVSCSLLLAGVHGDRVLWGPDLRPGARAPQSEFHA